LCKREKFHLFKSQSFETTSKMGEKPITNRSAAQVEEIRRRFIEDYEQNKDLYSLEDLERIKNSDWFVKRFYLSKNKNVDEATKMLIGTMRWRMEWEVPLMADWMYPIEFYKSGGLFPYEPDKEGNLVVYMRTCFHKKIPELEEFEKKYLLKVFDKVDKITDGNGFCIVFDLTNTGYSNVDIEFLRFLIECTTHYPVGLKYVLVYNLPWILNALRSTVMAFVPENLLGVLRFASGDEIFKFIDRENVPDYLGGACKRNYRQVPLGSRPVEELVEDVGLSQEDIDRLMPNFESILKNAEHQLAVNEYYDTDDLFDPPPDEEDFTDFREMNKMKYRMKLGEITKDEFMRKVNEKLDKYREKMKAKEQQTPDLIHNLNNIRGQSTPQSMKGGQRPLTSSSPLFNVIKVTPDKQLYFIYEPNEKSYIVHVCIENNTDDNVAFKIQSTSHALYNVSPCNGIISPKKTINCTIKTNNHNAIERADKFLILATKVNKSKMTFKEFKSIWNDPKEEVESVCLSSRLVNQRIDEILTQQSSSSFSVKEKDLNNKLGALVEKLHNDKQSKLNDYFRLFMFLTLIFAVCFLICLTVFCFLFNDEIVLFLISLKSNKNILTDRLADKWSSASSNNLGVAGFELKS